MNQASDPVVRHARAEDAALLAELGARTFEETFAADNRPEDISAYLVSSFGQAQLAAELADPQSLFLIAEIQEVAAGYAKLRAGVAPERVTSKKPIELERLYVSLEWLGRGVGAALMRVCIAENNHRARTFYRKWNFREVGEHIFQLGGDPQTDILMERSLTKETASSFV